MAFRGRRRFVSLVLATAIAGGVVGCQSGQKTAPPMQPPPMAAETSYRAGGFFAGPTTRPTSVSPTDALEVKVEWVALSRVAADLPPLLSHARLIAAPRDADPFLASGRLTRGARLVLPEQMPALSKSLTAPTPDFTAVPVGSTQGALPLGVTNTYSLATASTIRTARAEISLYRRPATRPTNQDSTKPGGVSIDCALGLMASPAPAERERVLLDPLTILPPAQLGIVVPSGSKDGVAAYLAILDFAPPSTSPQHQQAVAQLNEQLARAASAAAATQPADDQAGGPSWEGLATALNMLEDPAASRASLAYLGGETGATLCADVALAANDDVLAELTKRVVTHVGKPAPRMAPAQLGWLLELSCLEQLAAMQTAEKLPTELAAVASVHAGEAGRRPASLDELARAGTLDALAAKLVAENFNYLEDSSPAARVRAYDWLAAHSHAPPGYEPMGGVRERRAALDRAITAAATQAASSDSAAAARGGTP